MVRDNSKLTFRQKNKSQRRKTKKFQRRKTKKFQRKKTIVKKRSRTRKPRIVGGDPPQDWNDAPQLEAGEETMLNAVEDFFLAEPLILRLLAFGPRDCKAAIEELNFDDLTGDFERVGDDNFARALRLIWYNMYEDEEYDPQPPQWIAGTFLEGLNRMSVLEETWAIFLKYMQPRPPAGIGTLEQQLEELLDEENLREIWEVTLRYADLNTEADKFRALREYVKRRERLGFDILEPELSCDMAEAAEEAAVEAATEELTRLLSTSPADGVSEEDLDQLVGRALDRQARMRAAFSQLGDEMARDQGLMGVPLVEPEPEPQPEPLTEEGDEAYSNLKAYLMSLTIEQLMTHAQQTPSITPVILDRWLARGEELAIEQRLALMLLLLAVPDSDAAADLY